MENRLDLKRCLTVFNAVQTRGEKQAEYYNLEGFKAWSDFDGYTCFLQFNQTKVTLMFHGKYHIDCPNEQAFDEFEKKLSCFKV